MRSAGDPPYYGTGMQLSSISPITVAPLSRSLVCYVVRYLVCSHDRSVGILTRLRAGRSPARDFSTSPNRADRLWGPCTLFLIGYRQCLPSRTAAIVWSWPISSMSSPFYDCGVNTDRTTLMFLSYQYAWNALSKISNSSFGITYFLTPSYTK